MSTKLIRACQSLIQLSALSIYEMVIGSKVYSLDWRRLTSQDGIGNATNLSMLRFSAATHRKRDLEWNLLVRCISRRFPFTLSYQQMSLPC